MAGNPKGSPSREVETPKQRNKLDREPCSCVSDGTDHLLEAARHGWAVTIRYSILISITRWPALVCSMGGTGALTLAAEYARARGWI